MNKKNVNYFKDNLKELKEISRKKIEKETKNINLIDIMFILGYSYEKNIFKFKDIMKFIEDKLYCYKNTLFNNPQSEHTKKAKKKFKKNNLEGYYFFNNLDKIKKEYYYFQKKFILKNPLYLEINEIIYSGTKNKELLYLDIKNKELYIVMKIKKIKKEKTIINSLKFQIKIQLILYFLNFNKINFIYYYKDKNKDEKYILNIYKIHEIKKIKDLKNNSFFRNKIQNLKIVIQNKFENTIKEKFEDKIDNIQEYMNVFSSKGAKFLDLYSDCFDLDKISEQLEKEIDHKHNIKNKLELNMYSDTTKEQQELTNIKCNSKNEKEMDLLIKNIIEKFLKKNKPEIYLIAHSKLKIFLNYNNDVELDFMAKSKLHLECNIDGFFKDKIQDKNEYNIVIIKAPLNLQSIKNKDDFITKELFYQIQLQIYYFKVKKARLIICKDSECSKNDIFEIDKDDSFLYYYESLLEKQVYNFFELYLKILN